jgi:HK97 family phage portal protein
VAWWRRKGSLPRGMVITPEGLPVTAKSVPVPSGGVLATFEGLDKPWTYNGTLIVPDPGVPLAAYGGATAYDVWRTQPSVRKVVDYIARALATIPWHVYERVSDTDRRRVTDHPLAQLLAAPASGRSSSRLWHSIIVDWLIHDRWAATLLPSADTASGWELRRKPARRFHVLADDDDQPVALYVAYSGGQSAAVPVGGTGPAGERYIWDSGYAAWGADGTSPMETLRQLLDEQRESVEYRRQVWKNSARTPVVIERPADAPSWSTEAKSRFLEGFKRFIGRGAEAGGTPILEDGMRLVPVNAFAPKDTLDIEGRQLSDAEVASAYHIPPELVGAREGTFSNLDAFRQMLYTHSIGPDITMLEDVLNSQLVPLLAPGSNLYVEANVAAKLRGSFEEPASLLQTAVGAPYMLRAEARARQNLPYIDGTDELVTPLNVVTGGLASPTDTAPKAGGPVPKASSRPEGRPDGRTTWPPSPSSATPSPTP